MTIEKIVERAQSICLPLVRLAREAQVSPGTLHRAFERGSCSSRILKSLQDVLLRHELELQAHLNALHPELASRVDEVK